MGSTGKSGAEVILETESTLVYPGQSLRGEVITKTEENLKIKSVQLMLTCVEETHIRTRIPFISGDGGKKRSPRLGRLSGAYEKSVIIERSLTLRSEDAVPTPGARYPFEIEIPAEAIPSYSGRSATVGWWLEARVFPVSRSELVIRSEVTVLPLAQREPRRVLAASKPGAPVGLELEVFQDVVEPGNEVEGRLTVTRLKGKPQRISVRLIAHEFAKARQTVGSQIDTTDALLAAEELFVRERLREGVSQCFTLKVPDSTVTHAGKNSSSRLLVKAKAELRFRRDVSLSTQVYVGRLAQG